MLQTPSAQITFTITIMPTPYHSARTTDYDWPTLQENALVISYPSPRTLLPLPPPPLAKVSSVTESNSRRWSIAVVVLQQVLQLLRAELRGQHHHTAAPTLLGRRLQLQNHRRSPAGVNAITAGHLLRHHRLLGSVPTRDDSPRSASDRPAVPLPPSRFPPSLPKLSTPGSSLIALTSPKTHARAAIIPSPLHSKLSSHASTRAEARPPADHILAHPYEEKKIKE